MTRQTQAQPVQTPVAPRAAPITRARLSAVAKLAEVHERTLADHLAGLEVRRDTRVRIERALARAVEIDKTISEPDPYGIRFAAIVAAEVAGRK